MKIMQSTWVAIAIVFLAVTFSSGNVNAGLPKEVLKDKYLMGLSQALKNEDHKKALSYFKKLDKLKVKLPVSTWYFRGETYYKLENFTKANKALSTYIKKAGKKGKYYKEALTLLLDAEEKGAKAKVAKAKAKKAAVKVQKAIKNLKTGKGMVFVKGGCFEMGDTFEKGDRFSFEHPVHEVCLDDFNIGKYEVTQKEWTGVMGKNPSYFKGCDNCPVEDVSWEDIQKFIGKLKQMTGKNYRLPTEAEWEYAARSGGKKEKYSGGDDIDSFAWYDGNSGGKPHPVGQKQANGLGLYDMSGNVGEWVSDRFDSDYYKNSPKDNPKGPSWGGHRTLRGGSYDENSKDSRVSKRGAYEQVNGIYYYGFRLALSPQ